MELRLLFFSVLVVCAALTSRPVSAQDPQFVETEEIVEVDAGGEVQSTEVIFPDAEPTELPPIPTSPEFIPDESLMMDSLPPLEEFPEFDGGFEIPAFGSELDPARVIRQRIQIRRSRMKIASDPAMQALHAEAEATGTPYEYRAKMQEYYMALYNGVEQAHPDLAEVIKDERKKFLASVTTRRIRPTERPEHLPPLPEGAVPPGVEIEETFEVVETIEVVVPADAATD